MKRPLLLTMGMLGALIIVFAITKMAPSGMGLDRTAEPKSGSSEQAQQSAERLQGYSERGDPTMVQDDPAWKTKVRERPSAEEQAQKRRERLERRRIEVVETLEQYKATGMGDKHPAVVEATDDLRIIEAEQAAP
jgi:hypothetical protein